MIKFLDGPAAGAVLEVKRAPLFLRAVRSAGVGEWDALDQLDDTPKRRESIEVYVRQGPARKFHLKASRAAGGCRWVAWATYQHHPVQPEDHVARDAELWREWCRREQAELQNETGAPKSACHG